MGSEKLYYDAIDRQCLKVQAKSQKKSKKFFFLSCKALLTCTEQKNPHNRNVFLKKFTTSSLHVSQFKNKRNKEISKSKHHKTVALFH